jgi:hypothetical protein
MVAQEADMSQSLGSTPHLPSTATRSAAVPLRVCAAIGLIGIALIHLLDAPSKFEETPYQGWLFVILIIASLGLADRLLRSDDTWVWALTGLVAGATIVAFVISRTVGLPGAPGDVGEWEEPIAMASLLVEGIVVWLVALRLAPGSTDGR